MIFQVQVQFTFEFESQIRFSREFTIQCITTLFMCEHNRISPHITMVLIMKNESYHDSKCKP